MRQLTILLIPVQKRLTGQTRMTLPVLGVDACNREVLTSRLVASLGVVKDVSRPSEEPL